MGDNLGPNGLRMGSNHDARRLGIAVRSIRLNGSGTAIELDYAAPALAGGRFHDPEPEARHRWTTGSAPLPRAALALFDGRVELTLEIVSTAKYPRAEPAEPARLEAA
jgi:hypothetical protein